MASSEPRELAGATSYTYTASGQVQSVLYQYTGQPAQELDYTYFPDGGRQSLTWKSAGAQVAAWTYGYDLAGRLTSVSNSFGEGTSWSYDGEGKLKTQSNANGTALSLAYNEQRGWPALLTYTHGASTLAAFQVEYDGGVPSAGMVTGYTDQLTGASAGFGYDGLHRLAGESYTLPNQGGLQYSFGYSYDLAGNRTATNVDGNWTYTVDAGNKYTAVYAGAQGGGGGIPAWTWDADGNCTNPMGELAFGWNALSEMTSATALDPNTGQPTGVAYQFAWDGEGRMVSQTGTGVSARIHVYDGDLLLGELDGTGAPVAAYTWGADGLVSERLLSGTPRSLWYVFGPTGDTTYLLDAGGTVVDAYTFDAFGQRRATPNFGTDPNPFGYKGQFGYYTYAPSSTFLLCGARFYYPFWGRWLSRDPIGYDGGPNLYEYCLSDPVDLFDADGEGPDYIKSWICSFFHETAENLVQADRAGWRAIMHSPGSALIVPAADVFGRFMDQGILDRLAGEFLTSHMPGGSGVYDGADFADMLSEFCVFYGASAAPGIGGAAEVEGAGCPGAPTLTGIIEDHHLLPRQFAPQFKRAGLNIDDYKVSLDREIHKRIHGKGGGEAWRNSWNKRWERWFEENPSANAGQILRKMKQMRREFRI